MDLYDEEESFRWRIQKKKISVLSNLLNGLDNTESKRECVRRLFFARKDIRVWSFGCAFRYTVQDTSWFGADDRIEVTAARGVAQVPGIWNHLDGCIQLNIVRLKLFSPFSVPYIMISSLIFLQTKLHNKQLKKHDIERLASTSII